MQILFITSTEPMNRLLAQNFLMGLYNQNKHTPNYTGITFLSAAHFKNKHDFNMLLDINCSKQQKL
jgi:hypothetical protein